MLLIVARPVFKGSIWKNGPSPWDILTFKGHFEGKISNGSGIRYPQFEIVRIEIMRTDRNDNNDDDGNEISNGDDNMASFHQQVSRLMMAATAMLKGMFFRGRR